MVCNQPWSANYHSCSLRTLPGAKPFRVTICPGYGGLFVSVTEGDATVSVLVVFGALSTVFGIGVVSWLISFSCRVLLFFDGGVPGCISDFLAPSFRPEISANSLVGLFFND